MPGMFMLGPRGFIESREVGIAISPMDAIVIRFGRTRT